MIDLLVVGGGPVGLMSAIHAGSAGLSVTVVEPRSTPVDKACGEGLMPGAVAALAAVDVQPAGMPFGGIRYLQGDRQVEARFATGPGRGVRRTELHRALAARAEQLGVRFVEQRVTEVEQTAEWVGAAGVRARHLIGADGLHSTVRRAAGLQRPPGPIRRYGLRRHYRVVPWSDLVEVHWGPDAEVYVTPVAADTVGVAVLGRGPLDLDRTLSRLPALGQQLSGAAPVSEPGQRRSRGRTLVATEPVPGERSHPAGRRRRRVRRRPHRGRAPDRIRGGGGRRGLHPEAPVVQTYIPASPL